MMNDDDVDAHITPLSSAGSFRKRRDSPSEPKRDGSFGFGAVTRLPIPNPVITIASRDHVALVLRQWKMTVGSRPSAEIGDGKNPAFKVRNEWNEVVGCVQFDPDDGLLSFIGSHESRMNKTKRRTAIRVPPVSINRDAVGSAESLVSALRDIASLW